MLQAVREKYSAVHVDGNVFSAFLIVDGGDADVEMDWEDTGPDVLGSATGDRNKAFLLNLLSDPRVPDAAKEWALAEGLNQSVQNTGRFSAAGGITWESSISLGAFLANTVSHEVAHTFGLKDAYLDAATGATNVPPMPDLMNAASDFSGALSFGVDNMRLLEAAMGFAPNTELALLQALELFRKNFNLSGSASGIQTRSDPNPNTPELGVIGGAGTLSPGSAVPLGTVAIGQSAFVQLTVVNPTPLPLTIAAIELAPDSPFSATGIAAGTIIPAFGTASLSVGFSPTSVGSVGDNLLINSNAGASPAFALKLSGSGLSVNPTARLSAGANNFGGVAIGESTHRNTLVTINNDGLQPLTITALTIGEGSEHFALTGLPANLATTPIVIPLGESFSFGATFAPSKLGLLRGKISIATNDPSQPLVEVGIVGTGVKMPAKAAWGDDFVAVTTQSAGGDNTIRVRSDTDGNFNTFLPPTTPYEITIFDPQSGMVARDFGTTAPSGRGLDLSSTLVFRGSTEPDTDFDGLPDDIEFAIGTSARKADTDGDGLDDFASINQGLNPLGVRPLTTGVIANLTLQGQAKEVVLVGSIDDPSGQTAYVATGTFGLAIVDASNLQRPIVLNELNLPGDAVDVAVDSLLGIAAVVGAGAAGGLNLVVVSNPAAPKLLRTVEGSFTQVEVVDGVGYVGGNGFVSAIDLVTGEILQTLPLGRGVITGLTREGAILYSMDSARVLRAIDFSSGSMVARGSLTMPNGGGKLFVGNGIAYAGAGFGFATASVADPDALALLSGVDAANIAGTSVVANGSGLAVGVAQVGLVNIQNTLDVLDVSDPTNTAGIVGQFALPAQPRGVALGQGIAYVAADVGGLIVANYVSFDTNGKAPTASITSNVADLDPGLPGLQVLEGTTLTVTPTIADDVQVRNVELIVNGQVVGNDVSFPFELATVALGADGMARVQLRATDTGGNTTLSNELTFDLFEDVVAPMIESISPADGSEGRPGRQRVTVQFNESMDPATLVARHFSLSEAGVDGLFSTGDDTTIPMALQIRNDNRIAQLTFSPLLAGHYRLGIDATALTDRAGNALGSQDIFSTFNLSLLDDPSFEIVGNSPGYGVGFNPSSLAIGDVDDDGDLDWVTANQGHSTVSVLFNDGDGAAQGRRLDFAVGSIPVSVALGDLDGDGDLDLVTANNNANTVTVLKNDGLGNFGSRLDVAVGNFPRAVALGNVDTDGDLDLVVGNYVSNTVSVFRNDGTGTFGSRADISFNRPRFIVMGNVDGDSDLDMLIAGKYSTTSVTVMKNNGTGTFTPSGSFSVLTGPVSIALGDVDGDNDLDLASGSEGGGVTVLLNTGTGVFGSRADLTTDGGILSVKFGDLDADGDRDLVAGGVTFDHAAVFRNNGAGAFGSRRDFRTGVTQSLALADFDGDGDQDLAAAVNGATVRVLPNDGDAGFGDPVVTVADRPVFVSLADLNGDGDLDIVTANSSSNTVSVALGAGAGAFLPRLDVVVGSSPVSVVLADVDGDWDLDLITANSSGNSVSVLRNDGAGGFGSGVNVAVATSPQAVLAGDFDGDLDADLAVVNSGTGDVTILLNNGTGDFGSRVDYASVTSNQTLAMGDVDGDGDLDLMTGANVSGSQSLALLLNDSHGVFAAAALFDGGANMSLALRDLDGDTDLDLVAVSGAQLGSILVIANDGTGEFDRLAIDQRKFYTLGGSSLGPITLGDLDGDSDLDIAISHLYDNDVSVLLNDGSGGFGTPTAQSDVFVARYLEYAAGNRTIHVTIGDIDGDGDMDIAAANRDDRSVTLLLNDGAAGFGARQFPTGLRPESLALGDVNGDGILDAVTGNEGSSGDAVSVLLGDGSGGFGPRQVLAAGASTRTVALGDVDGDGDLDLVTAGYTGFDNAGTIHLLRNDGAGNFSAAETVFSGNLRPLSMALGDVNGDGNLDIATANNSQFGGQDSVAWFVNDGSGGFNLVGLSFVSGLDGPESVTLGDVNGDGALDLVVVNTSPNRVMVMFNDGFDGFGAATSFDVGSSPRYVRLADLDGDGDLDLTTSNINGGNLTVLFNNGSGSFSNRREFATGPHPRTLAVGDIDGDGDLDIVTASTSGGPQSLFILVNDGDGGFDRRLDYIVGSRHTYDVRLGDVDGDGDVDIVALSSEDSSISVLIVVRSAR